MGYRSDRQYHGEGINWSKVQGEKAAKRAKQESGEGHFTSEDIQAAWQEKQAENIAKLREHLPKLSYNPNGERGVPVLEFAANDFNEYQRTRGAIVRRKGPNVLTEAKKDLGKDQNNKQRSEWRFSISPKTFVELCDYAGLNPAILLPSTQVDAVRNSQTGIQR